MPDWHRAYVSGSTESLQNTTTNHGFIAQEVSASIVTAGDDIKDGFEGWRENATNDLQRVADTAFIGPLIKAVQELSAEVNNLQAQISGSSDFNALKTAVSGSS